jgi:hypothetical protein
MALYETLSEIIDNLDENGFLYGEVVLDLDDIIETNPDDFLDLLSEGLVGSELLLDVDYRALRTTNDGEVVIGVYGDPRVVISDLQSEEDE